MTTAGVHIVRDKARILVVEDEGIIARDIRSTLEELGYHVTGLASSGSEALEMAESQPADLVLMDIRIHGDMDGVETAERIRQRFHLPVVYLTAHTDTPTLDRAKASEPFGYIVKPFTVSDIKVAVEIALQRHKLQHQIEERETWLSAVLRSAGDAVVVSGADSRITYVNSVAEDLLGLKSGGIFGRDLAEVVRIRCDQDSPDLAAAVEKTRTTGELQFATGTLLRSDGAERTVVSSIAPLRRDADEGPQGTVLVLRDVSDFRKTEQALRETNWFLSRSNDHLTALSYSLTHDLKEPLRAVSCYSQLLAGVDHKSFGAPEQEYLQYITQGCRRMEQLLSSLMDYYRAGIVDAACGTAVDPSEPLNQALSNLQAAVTASGALIQIDPLPTVYVHPTALVQIFQNLLGNALRYRRPETQPRIEISSNRDGEFSVFTISDNGSGFPPSQSEHIFGLFKRGHGREESGSGIGLATCRRLIEHYGGKIWAESTPGEGAQFFFKLPASPHLV